MEFDIFVPKYSLAFEYQGEHHYSPTYIFNSGQQNFQERDLQKAQACKQFGISLITVPFWWDKKQSSLHATIVKGLFNFMSFNMVICFFNLF
jgi:hypothetical protein